MEGTRSVCAVKKVSFFPLLETRYIVHGGFLQGLVCLLRVLLLA